MSRIMQLEKIGIKDPKFVTVTRAFDFIMSILADNAGNVIVSVFPGKNGWFSISTTEALKDADYQNIISENEFLRALLDDIDALNIEITDKGYIYKCIAKCPISGTVLSKESYLDQDERKASITFRNGFDKSDMDEKKLHKCIRKIFYKEYPNLCIILYGQGSNIIMS